MGDHGDRPTLGAVVGELGSIVTLAAATPGAEARIVGRSVIHDPLAPAPLETDDVVLAVGTPAGGDAAIDLVREAGAAGATAVAFRAPATGQGASTEAAAEAAGVALLWVADTLTWSQLLTLLRSAAGAGAVDPRGDIPLGDLFRLANAIAAMVGGPTTIEDRESTVLAYSSHDGPVDEHRRQTILGHRVPESWRRRLQDDGVFRRLVTEPGPTRLDYPDADPPLRPRLAIAVRAGDEVLGSIWVAEGDRPFDEAAERALADAAPIAALHLLRWQASEDVDRARRESMVRAVLEGSTPPAALAAALDLDAGAYVTVLAFRVRAERPEDAAFRARRARDLIVLYCESFRRKAASIAVGAVVYVLVPDVDEPDRARLRRLAEDIVERVREPLGIDVTAAVGSTMAGLDGVAVSRRHADQVLDVLDTGGVGVFEDHRASTILASFRELARLDPELLDGPLSSLRAHDDEHRSTYVDTLRAYLDAFGDVPAAAAALGVHQNTFRYRLRRLLEIADLDLGDPVARLVLHLQLHLAP